MPKAPILERRFFPQDSLICEEGEEAYVAYIVQAGKVRVFSLKDGKRIEFATLEAGDVFGETALVLDGKRSASVEAITDCNMIVITREAFNNKLEKSDPTIRAVVRMLSERMKKSNYEIVKSKGVNVDSFIALLNQLFRDLLEMMPEDKKTEFRKDAFPLLKDLIKIIEDYREYLT